MNPRHRNVLATLFSLTFCIGLSVRLVAWQTQQHKRDEALIEAVMARNIPLVRSLLDEGADPNTSSTFLTSEFTWDYLREWFGQWRKHSHYEQPVLLLVIDPRMILFTPSGLSEDELAKCAQIYKLLLDKGARADTTDANGNTPLQMACMYGMADTANLFLEDGASVNARDGNGETALSYSLWKPELVSLLLLHGADENLRFDLIGPRIWSRKVENATPENATPLIGATFYGQAESVKILLEKGAEVNARDSRGHTALYYAKAGYLDVSPPDKQGQVLIQLLKQYGAKE